MLNLKLKIKLGLVVAIYCAIAYLNSTLKIFSDVDKVNHLISRGAELSILLYVMFLIISSYSSIKLNKKGDS